MSRSPYTYAADYVRSLLSDADLSRSQASQIRTGIAAAIGMDDAELAHKLSDYYEAHLSEPVIPFKIRKG